MKMSRLFLITAAVSALSIGLWLPVKAQDSKSKSSTSEHQQAAQSSENLQAHPKKVSEQDLRDKKVTKINKASSFIGMTVKNLQNDTLGKVDDLAFNPDSGQIAYAVLSVGGFLGLNEKYIAVPLNALTPAPGEDKLFLDADKQRLQNAPGFAKNNWPDLDAPAWSAAAGFARGAVGRPGRSGQEQGSASGKSDQTHFSGTISALDTANHKLTVKNEAGSEKHFALDPNVQVSTSNEKNAKLEDLKVGSEVSVQYTHERDQDIAKAVHADASDSSQPSSDKKE
jgi:hypothetical protein